MSNGTFFSGVTQGVANIGPNLVKGEMDREKINQLKEIGQQRRQQFDLNTQRSNLQNEQLALQVQNLQTQLVQQDMNMLQNESYRYIDEYLNSGANTKDGILDDRYLTSAYVEHPLLNQSMSRTLGMKQITDVQNDGTGNLIFKDSTSRIERKIPLEVFLPSIGYFTKRDTISTQKAEANLEKLEKIWKVKKLQAEATGSDQPSLKDIKTGLDIKEKQLSIKEKQSEAEISNEITKVDTLASEGKDKDVYEIVSGNTKLYQEIFPQQSDRNQIKDGRTALRIGEGLRDLKIDLDKAINADKVGGIPNMVTTLLGRYGIGTDSDVSKAALAEALRTRGESLTADQLKLITGAAFNETEMQVKLRPLISAIVGYDGSKVAKQKFDAAVSEWDRTASNYISTLPKSQQSYVKGSLQSNKTEPKIKTFNFKGKDYEVGTKVKTKDGRIAQLSEDGKWLVQE